MARSITFVVVVATACLFGWAVPLLRLFDGLQPMTTALSIVVAAVFVRLNRGMPTLEWKSADPDQRAQLTSQIVSISQEYAWIIAINGLFLIGLLTLSVVGKKEIMTSWPAWVQNLSSGAIGAMGALSVARMAYVVWRDIDIVRLQKHLVDSMAAKESNEQQAKLANDKVATIRASGLRKIDVVPPKPWGE